MGYIVISSGIGYDALPRFTLLLPGLTTHMVNDTLRHDCFGGRLIGVFCYDFSGKKRQQICIPAGLGRN